jgi:hypothetical protein
VSASVEAFNVEVLDVPIPERFVESDDTVVAEFQKDVYDGPSFLASEKEFTLRRRIRRLIALS